MKNVVASYLIERLPEGMSHSDAVQLFLRLFGTADGMPHILHPQLSRVGLADAFAELARAGWVHAQPDGPKVSDSSHWDELIKSMFKKGPDAVDLARGEELMRRIGYYHETPVA